MLGIYEKVRSVPAEAKKPIGGGKLRGMTDINPMWRIKKLTEMFGPCGFGWYYTVEKEWTEVVGDEVCAFVNINLFIKWNGEWSQPIHGTGGSKLATIDKNGLSVSDECYKMATTDAISVACKQLGFGADVYWDKDKTKYSTPEEPKATEPKKEDKQEQAIKEASAKAKVMGYINRHGWTDEQIAKTCKCYGVDSIANLNIQHCEHFIAALTKRGGNIDE